MPGSVDVFQVEHYVVELGFNEVSPGKGAGNVPLCATIRCYDADPPTEALLIRFQPRGSEPAANSFDPEGSLGRTGVVYRPFDEFALYVDLLRNEGPVYAFLFAGNPAFHYLATNREPVGEGERQIVIER